MDKDSREPGLPASNYFDEAGFLSSGIATDVVFEPRAAESRVTLVLMETEEKVGIT